MNVQDAAGSSIGSLAMEGGQSEGRERGSRRRKLAGYLKVANELRQSYQQVYAPTWSSKVSFQEGQDGPGGFADASIVNTGDEEMLLFPSYARRHIKAQVPRTEEENQAVQATEGADGTNDGAGTQDAKYWRQEWERWEDDKAIVDVDVRGWIYSSHSGPLGRKNRLMIGLARHLSGVPAPASNPEVDGYQSDDALSRRSFDIAAAPSKGEEELVTKEAESIVRRGHDEAANAGRGAYSEGPDRSAHNAAILSPDERNQSASRLSSTGRQAESLHPTTTNRSTGSGRESSPDQAAPAKRSSWNQPTDMSPAELTSANTNLVARLKPFLSTPLSHVPITVFFFNEKTSQSRTIETNESGHFWIRAALAFVPTTVRVLASESLSATEDVIITEPRGVSLISDIDDTIKHSAVGSGAKEIFRNTFVRELGDLNVEGVRDWYGQLAEIGVKLHYVSNSPWQLYPLLVSFFSMAGLPPGSFHLKHYSGMLQGIFEPVAERKKGSLERIMGDFPERKFILVGDSGEADLEVYTDVVLANPGRVAAVYIRDVTTPPSRGFFDPSVGPAGESRAVDAEDQQSVSQPHTLVVDEKSALDQAAGGPKKKAVAPKQESDPAGGASYRVRPEASRSTVSRIGDQQRLAPAPPAKPSSLRQSINQEPAHQAAGNRRTGEADSSSSRKTPPPLPPKPPAYAQGQSSSTHSKTAPASETPVGPPAIRTPEQEPPDETQRDDSNLLRRTVATAYNKLPSASAILRGVTGTADHSAASESSLQESSNSSSSQPPSQPRSAAYDALQRTMTAPTGSNSFTHRAGGEQGSRTDSPVQPSNTSSSRPSEPPPPPRPRRRQQQAPPPPPPPSRRALTSYPDTPAPTTATASPSVTASLASRAINRLSESHLTSAQASDTVEDSGTVSTSHHNMHPSNSDGASGQRSNASSVTNNNNNNNNLTATATTAAAATATSAANYKREELWRRRWSRAQETFEKQGVALISWRVGTDVIEQSVKLVKKILHQDRKEV